MSFTRTNSLMPSQRDPTIPRFHIEPVQDDAATAAAGRPIYRNEERVQFIQPGSPNQPVFRISDEHKQRWPEEYAAFRRGEDMATNGTPLEHWPILSRAMVLELKALGLFTVEQCAGMADTAVQRVGRGGYGLRERAKAYLDDAEAMALSERLNRENELLNERQAEMERTIKEQGAMLQQLSTQLLALQNAPSPIETYVPGQHDPMEAARQRQPHGLPETSSLDDLTPPKPRGRRPTQEAA